MKDRKKTLFIFIINAVIAGFLILLHYSGTSIKILNANPLSPLALLVALIMFSGEVTGMITGLAVGIILDGFAMTPAGFNTVVFATISFVAVLLSHYIFNRNLKSALMLCLICSMFYFFLRWLFVFAFSTDIADGLDYLIKNALGSSIYTAVLVVPFFFLEKRLFENSNIKMR